jgi:hypothetical protein
MKFFYENLSFRYEPFPIGLARPLMDESLYQELLDAYPDIDLLESYDLYGKPGNKYSLTERINPRDYYRFIKSTPVWREFHRWITSTEFIYETLTALKELHGIDLGYKAITRTQRLRRRLKDLKHGRLCPSKTPLRARFEFSALPANGGMVVPHTDAPRKVVTFVVSMVREDEWNRDYGGGTDINRPRDPRLNFNYVNHLADFEDMDVIDTFDYTANQAVVFIKTFNSWHSVRPMTGPDNGPFRRSITINIEKRY